MKSISVFISLLTICFSSNAFAVGLSNGVDLSFFDKPPHTETPNKDSYSPAQEFTKGIQAYRNNDYMQAFQRMESLARFGHVRAQYVLATMYHNGQGVVANQIRAVHWYKAAAENGHPVAQHNLGVFFLEGNGVLRNDAKAMYWFNKAAVQGYVESQYNLGIMYYTARGVSRNTKQAFTWFKRAAAQGDSNSQYNLGTMYQKGIGVSKNMILAFKWHTKAAQNGNRASLRWIQQFSVTH